MIGIDPRDEEPLTRYVLEWYRHLLTDMELDALRALSINLKAVNVESVMVKCKLGDVLHRIQSPDVTAMLANGPDSCRRTIRDRLMREHQHEIVLVKCPQSNRLARTPNARMCVHCGHAWHRKEQT